MRRRWTSRAWVGLLVAGASLAATSPAQARPVYAAPAAAGTADCSSPANACTVTDAAQQVDDTDELLLAGGVYRGTGQLDLAPRERLAGVAPEVLVRAADDSPVRPTLSFSGGVEVGSAVTVRGVEIALSDASVDLDFGGTLDRVLVAGTNSGSGLVRASGSASIRASEIFNSARGGIAVASAPSAATNAVTIRSSTLVADRPDGVALSVRPAGATTQVNLRVVNTILHGSQTTGDNGRDLLSLPQAAAKVAINLSSAAYNPFEGRTQISDDGSTTVSSQNPVFAAPQFVDIASGNYRQAPGSPTIDAGGAIEPQSPLEQTDLSGNLRPANGTAPDIGAFEQVGAPAVGTPAGVLRSTSATVDLPVEPRSGRTVARVDYVAGGAARSAVPQAVAAQTGTAVVTFELTGLQPDTSYAVRGVVSSDGGSATGDPITFRTLPAPVASAGPDPAPSQGPGGAPAPAPKPPEPARTFGKTLVERNVQSFPDIVITTGGDPISLPVGPYTTGVNFGVFLGIHPPSAGRRSASAARARKLVVLGRGRLTLAAGKTGKIKIRLTATGRRTLRRERRVRARLVLTATDLVSGQRVTAQRSFTLKLRKPRR